MSRTHSVLSASLSILSVAALAAPALAAGGEIKGTVKLTGKVPEAKALNMNGDAFCAKKGGKDEEIVASSKGELKNVVVRVTKGATGAFQAPSSEVVLDQDGCLYKPRVVVAQAGQNITIKNSDQTLHNVHTYKGPATLFNQAQPQNFPPIKKKFPTAGDVVKFKCDVHPWMTAYVVVTDNPFAAVTGDDGSFTIKDVPAGTYTVEIWHEKLGTKTQQVKVTDGKPSELKVELAAK